MSKDEIKLKWQQAPVKTQWGDEMVVASVAIDKDHTVCLYCERDQTSKVDAMFAQRTWVALTTKEIREWWASENGLEDCLMAKLDDFEQVARAIEAKLKEKNT